LIQYTKTETVYFKDESDMIAHLNALVASEDLRSDTVMGLKTSGLATRQTSVSGMPAMETHTVASMDRICMNTP